MTKVYEMDLRAGKKVGKSLYSLPPEKAISAYLQQKRGNWDTWTYPDKVEGVKKSIKPHTLFIDLGKTVVYAIVLK